MTRARNVLLVLIITVLCNCAISHQFRKKRSGRDYILHSCTATAHLVRKNRNHAITRDNLRNSSALETPFSLPKRSSKYYNANIKSGAINPTVEERGKIKSPDKRLHGRRIENHLLQNGLSRFSFKDTPLKTVHIKSIHKNRPPMFTKKDPLPELERHIPGRKINTDASVVVVRPLH